MRIGLRTIKWSAVLIPIFHQIILHYLWSLSYPSHSQQSLKYWLTLKQAAAAPQAGIRQAPAAFYQKWDNTYCATSESSSDRLFIAPDEAAFLFFCFFFIPKMLISVLFVHINIWCGYSFEVPRRGASNEYPQHTFSLTNKSIYQATPPIWTFGSFCDSNLYHYFSCVKIDLLKNLGHTAQSWMC